MLNAGSSLVSLLKYGATVLYLVWHIYLLLACYVGSQVLHCFCPLSCMLGPNISWSPKHSFCSHLFLSSSTLDFDLIIQLSVQNIVLKCVPQTWSDIQILWSQSSILNFMSGCYITVQINSKCVQEVMCDVPEESFNCIRGRLLLSVYFQLLFTASIHNVDSRFSCLFQMLVHFHNHNLIIRIWRCLLLPLLFAEVFFP